MPQPIRLSLPNFRSSTLRLCASSTENWDTCFADSERRGGRGDQRQFRASQRGSSGFRRGFLCKTVRSCAGREIALPRAFGAAGEQTCQHGDDRRSEHSRPRTDALCRYRYGKAACGIWGATRTLRRRQNGPSRDFGRSCARWFFGSRNAGLGQGTGRDLCTDGVARLRRQSGLATFHAHGPTVGAP